MERPPAKVRVNRIALARFEQWALPRLAKRMPQWVSPDSLTMVGLVAAVLIALAYILTWYSLGWLWLASAAFVLHWFGDSLDGTLARVRNIRRERYGFYVDHQADAISALLIFTALGLSPLMPLVVALLVLIGYYLMMIMVNLVTISRDVFKISFGGAGPTEARLAMITANTAVFFSGNAAVGVFGYELTLFTVIGLLGAVVLLGYYAVFSLIERSKLALLDPTPSRPTSVTGEPVQISDGVAEDDGVTSV